MKNIALIMAAGTSSRCGFDKLLAELNQKSVLEQCLSTFQLCDMIDEIWVVGKEVPPLGLRGSDTKLKGSIEGGDSRFKSVKAGIQHCESIYDEDVRIIVHNAANPFLLKVDLESGLVEAKTKENLIFGFFTPNSIKQVIKDGIVNNFLDREQIFETQTPQISTLENFSEAFEVFRDRSQSLTLSRETGLNSDEEPKDEAELLALLEKPIHVYECAPSNTKITFASDFKSHICHPEFISRSKNQSEIPDQVRNDIRIGIGEDSHRFANNFDPEKPFRLGGVDMSEDRLSSDGNSDGDVILHALCNALLSAFGDKTFDPIAAPICAGGETNSKAYLTATLKHLEEKHDLCVPSALRAAPLNPKGAKIKQLLISLEGAQPRISPQHDEIVLSLTKLLNIQPSNIGLTYTTGEGLSECGQGLGIRSYVLITLEA